MLLQFASNARNKRKFAKYTGKNYLHQDHVTMQNICRSVLKSATIKQACALHGQSHSTVYTWLREYCHGKFTIEKQPIQINFCNKLIQYREVSNYLLHCRYILTPPTVRSDPQSVKNLITAEVWKTYSRIVPETALYLLKQRDMENYDFASFLKYVIHERDGDVKRKYLQLRIELLKKGLGVDGEFDLDEFVSKMISDAEKIEKQLA